jgi:hypothetical protein
VNAIEKVLALSRGEAVADDDLLEMTWSPAAREASALARKNKHGVNLDDRKFGDSYKLKGHSQLPDGEYIAAKSDKPGHLGVKYEDPGDGHLVHADVPQDKIVGHLDRNGKDATKRVSGGERLSPNEQVKRANASLNSGGSQRDQSLAVLGKKPEPKIIDNNAGLPKSDMRATTKGFKSDSHVAKVKADAAKFRKDNPHLYGPNGEDLQARAKPGEYGYHKIKKGK